jgi:N6-L-threonylcarbamoyladenine synthase
MKRILGIESTCDETAASVVVEGREILSNVVASQADLHEVFGGVVPELACRRHADAIIPVIDQALQEADCTLEDIDAIAVAQGPGLIGALLIGINSAKALSLATGKPLVAVNHVEAHLYAAMMNNKVELPCLGVVISGGHTALLQIDAIGSYQLLGQTVDDAIGEAFDKAAKILELPYPGGPQIEQLAKQGCPDYYPLRGGRVKGHPLAFSFSGLKTGVLYAAKGQSANSRSPLLLSEAERAHLAASFQKAAFDDLIDKILLATKKKGVTSVLLGGGVANNRYLRARIEERCPDLQTWWPDSALTLDNAAMIAGLGYHVLKQKGPSPLTFPAETRIPLGTIPLEVKASH